MHAPVHACVTRRNFAALETYYYKLKLKQKEIVKEPRGQWQRLQQQDC